ncbi:Zinc finger protein 569 [Labeo rohita]|uniref:Zinc finger protein 569 n=1 Tax=Labeo rohita TaxID=84645 RepID=A0ABQ8LB62_LABRO|nr:Zinc finger protein 569 [Labeo rohita]
MAFIKEEKEDMRIEEAFRVKHEDTEEQTDLMALKEERHELTKIEEKDQYERINFMNMETSIQTETTPSQIKVQKTESNSYFTCLQCGKSFNQKYNLKNHMKKVHAGEKPYTCNLCGKSFSYKTHLDSHMKSHTGEKPYTCRLCGKSFLCKGSLKMHMVTHTGEKPFPCDQCEKCFRHKATLDSHMKTHTGESPYMCKPCGKSFSHKSTLNAHIRNHTGERPFTCNIFVTSTAALSSGSAAVHGAEDPQLHIITSQIKNQVRPVAFLIEIGS